MVRVYELHQVIFHWVVTTVGYIYVSITTKNNFSATVTG